MVTTTRINENVYLHYIPMDKLKTSSVRLFIHRALAREEATKNALLSRVLKRGCGLCRNNTEIEHYLQNLYGAVFVSGITKKGNDQIIDFSMEGISDKYAPEGEKISDGMIKLIMSSVFEPVEENGGFNAETVEQEKINLKDKINGLINDKRSYALHRCVSEMCAGEPAGIYRYGIAEDTDKINPVDLYRHYKGIITSSVIDIFICGDMDIASAEKTVREYTDRFEFKKAELPSMSKKEQSGDVKNVEDRLDVTQGKLAVGFRTNILADDEKYFALMVLNSIFGAGAHSKLFNNVREKLSLAYYAASRLERNSGLLIMDAGIEFENYQRALDETITQLENIKKGDISDEELNSSIKAILNSLENYNDDQYMLIDWHLGQKVSNTDFGIDEVKRRVEEITAEDVKKAAEGIQLDTVYFLNGKENV